MDSLFTVRSAQGKGIFTMGLVNIAFQPLNAISSRAEDVYNATRAEIKQNIKTGMYSKGLAEQYAVQLERLNRNAPACEFIGFPGLLSFPSV